jgi:putative endonuclease
MRTPAWTVYMLRCSDGSIYTGITKDLPRRLAQHRAGRGSAYTRSHLPLRVVFTESRRTRGAALRREAALKALTRGQKLALISALTSPRPSRALPPRGGPPSTGR